jgi:shikimate dehydrogenase
VKQSAPLVGLIGAGIQRSLTPAMQQAEAAHHGLRMHYQLIDLAATHTDASALPKLLDAARIMGFAGLNITYPCKQAVVELLDELSPEAQAIGAVNTVVFDQGRSIGHNTDCSGWAWGLKQAHPRADLGCVVLLGAGGAGCAIAHALAQMQVHELIIIDESLERAQALANSLAARYCITTQALTSSRDVLPRATGLVNATPVGMDMRPGTPLPLSSLHSRLWVADAIYFPIDTILLQAARQLGCTTIDGGTMAVGQALGAFELFTGLRADTLRMRQHFLTLLERRDALAA